MSRKFLLPGLVVLVALAAPVARAVSDGNYDPSKQGCSGTAENSDHPAYTQEGCYTVAVHVSDRAHRYVLVGVPQTPEGTNANAAEICIDLTGTMKCARFDQSGFQVLPDRKGTPVTPPASPGDAELHAYFGADDNLDSGEHDGSKAVGNGASDGGAVQANVAPTTAVDWLHSVLYLNRAQLLTHPLAVGDAGMGACADGLCFSVQTQRRIAYTAGSEYAPTRDAADYDGHTWDPPGCAGPSDTVADCAPGGMAWWHTHNQTTYVEPGIQIYEDPDPQGSPAGPYPLAAFYVGTCGLVAGGGNAPAFPASPFTNASGQVRLQTGCDAGSKPTPVGGCASWSAFGHDAHHSFAVPAACSPISHSTIATLAPAWFTPTKDSVTASPTVAGDTAYVGSWDGTFYAMDISTGAVRWTFQTRAHAPTAFGRIVSTATVSDWSVLDGSTRRVVVFGGGSSVWVLDAATGTELASLDLDPRTLLLRAQQEASGNQPVVEVESSPALATVDGQQRFFVGLDVHNTAGVGRTGIVSLALTQARSGPWSLRALWKLDAETGQTYTGSDALTIGSGQGRGCGGVWSSPAVDEATGIVTFGTASCSHPAEQIAAGENYEEGMVAADARTGHLRWRFRPADALTGTDAKVADAGRDADFGASPNIFSIGSHTVVGEGRKSGEYVVRDLLTGTPVSLTKAGAEGFVQQDFGIGGFLGTTAVDTAADGSPIVVGATAIPAPHSPTDVDQATQAVRALDPRTGTVLWTYRLAGPSYAHTSVVDHIALVPDTTTSSVIALDTTSGLPLWTAPVVGPPSSTAVVAGNTMLVGTGTRETDLEYKAVNSQLQDALQSTVGASPLSPISGVQAFRLAASSSSPPASPSPSAASSPPETPSSSSCTKVSVRIDPGTIRHGHHKGVTGRCLRPDRLVKLYLTQGGKTRLVTLTRIDKHGTARSFFTPTRKGKARLTFVSTQVDGQPLKLGLSLRIF